MTYPTINEVNSADHEQICHWFRFLSSPGNKAIGQSNFREILEKEATIMDRIVERFDEFNGMTPEISKSIGWG